MPLNRATEANPPTLAEFGLTEASVEDAHVVEDRVNFRCGLLIFSLGAGIFLTFFLVTLASSGNVAVAIVGSMVFGGALASLAGIALGLLLMPVLPQVLPQYAQAKRVLQRFEQFRALKNTFETEQRRKQTDYWFSLSPSNFEKEIAGLLVRLGLCAVVTPASGDEGIDIYAESGGTRAIVQCKQYAHRATPAIVRELYGALIADGAELAILACTGGFTSGVHAFASGKPIHLIDLDGLLRLVEFAQRRNEKSGHMGFAELLAIASTTN
jgi:hypothetical protein